MRLMRHSALQYQMGGPVLPQRLHSSHMQMWGSSTKVALARNVVEVIMDELAHHPHTAVLPPSSKPGRRRADADLLEERPRLVVGGVEMVPHFIFIYFTIFM
jgi:hypothetical protein